MIAVSEEILKEYIRFKSGDHLKCRFDILENFFKNFYPFVTSKTQLENIGFEKKTILTLMSSTKKIDELNTRIINASTTDSLIGNSQLKVLLTHDSSTRSINYLTINILNNSHEVSKRFSATYEPRVPRHNAIKHIKSLIEDSSLIKIYDKYMSWKGNALENIAILKKILPMHASVELHLENNETFSTAQNDMFKNNLAMARADLTINWNPISNDIHDRYINAGTIEILLSSGLYYLKNRDKDFTYVVNI